MLTRIFKKIYQYRLMFKIKRQVGLVVGKNLQLRGKPILIIANNAEIRIGDNVTLNSRNDTYHLNLFAPVKIMADKENAKIVIGSNTRIHGSCIHAQKGVYIGENCLIAANSQIFDSDGHELLMEEPEKRLSTRGESREIFIEDNVWIGTGCIILKGVKIGQGSIVAAGSVVVKNVPQNSIVGGNPAGIIKQF